MSKTAAIDAALRDQAIDWYVCMVSGLASDADRAALARWCQADAAHEHAWQRVAGLGLQMEASRAALDPALARSTLKAVAFDAQGRRRTLKLLAGGGIGLSLIGSAVLTRGEPSLMQQALADHRSGTGERRALILADGTRLQLNTATTVDVHFDAQARRIRLYEGEIEIVTGTDAQRRPLVVATQDGELRPLGTRFTVRRLATEAQTRITVSEGRVQIARAAAAERQIVEAGEQARFSVDGIQPAEPLAPTEAAWTRGMLAAERMRLGDFIAELDRYRPGVLRCDPAVADLRLTGAFPLDDPERILLALEQTLPVRVSGRSRYWRTVTAR